ncbi:hypothetical protein [Gluconacetobacter diazotrophicus]|uniref:hypothetical protein n=1 Tax=Gluconacetobacter diazotrophicus TaxID=33996 RepID=UPI00119B8649|nr:hypothetical protein [Gluconacetobacter diazotrophicus]TWB02481.1 hypothetical protein FBZ86_1284 [Gluconacetobacter diazotrophicus]
MSKAVTISDLLGAPGMFYRSVALERDASDPSAGRSFVMTPWLERGATEILSGMQPGGTRRAWRIIGDFGVGKSALALALVQALDPRTSSLKMPMRRLADRAGGAPRMFPLLVTGSRDGLAAGLAVAIKRILATDGLVAPKRAAALKKMADPFEVIVSLRDALRDTGRFDGLLLVIDEMGKFLEAAGEEEGFDVFRLQSLAEEAARSGDAPLAVILILHKGFQSYAEDWRTARRSEWEKVAERFEEMVFDHPLSHTAALLSTALAVDKAAIPVRARKAYAGTVERVRTLGWLGPRNGKGADGCWPVHPAAIPVMARFFASYGQNERSLFGFAASEEPNGLRAFAGETPATAGLYGIRHFFDYIASSFGHRLTSRAGAGEWSRISAVLDRAADADVVESAVLKTIGILNLLDAPDLPAMWESIREALTPDFTSSDIEAALNGLIAAGLVFRRPGRAELRLWTSRRVDLSAIWSDAEREIDARAVIDELPRHLSNLPIRPHILARRHSVRTGTSRRFAVRCTHASALEGYAGHGNADGGIVAVLCGNAEDSRIARAWCAEVTSEDDTMIAIAMLPTADLGHTMVDLLRHRWIVTNASSLQEDAHASAEIERNIGDLETRLVHAIEAALGLRGHSPSLPLDIFWDGKVSLLDRPLHALVSALCDEIYDKAPLVENELVNKQVLTSAGAGARQRLIEKMFSYAHDPELGFAGGKNPPERALYLSLLRRGGLHREGVGGWTIVPPKNGEDTLRLAPALAAINSCLDVSGGRVQISTIYALLEAKPYGVRTGLVPLLMAVTLVAVGHRVALFERGTYCPRIDGAAFMRILKSPEHFALQLVSLEGIRADVFRRLAELFGQRPDEPGIRAVVDPLIRFGVELPFHTQNTTILSVEARGVRRALAKAHSPVDLVFKDLPLACGMEPFGTDAYPDPARVNEFVLQLDAAVTELRGCYPKLLQDMQRELLETLGAPDRAAIAERATSLSFRLTEQHLRTFALRLADTRLSEEKWIEALGGAILMKPPVRWLDHDVATWRSRLADIGSQFRRVEAVTFGKGQSKRSAVRVSLTRVDGRERAVIVDIDELDAHQVNVLGAIERMATEANLSLDKVAALLSLESMQKDQDVMLGKHETERDHG